MSRRIMVILNESKLTYMLSSKRAQSWGAVRDCGGQQHIAPAIVQYHDFFAFMLTFCVRWSLSTYCITSGITGL